MNDNGSNFVNNRVNYINITLEEYNELLIFKGRYLELSNMFDTQQSSEEYCNVYSSNKLILKKNEGITEDDIFSDLSSDAESDGDM